MPDLCVEKMDCSGEFQNFVVATRLMHRGVLENASLLYRLSKNNRALPILNALRNI